MTCSFKMERHQAHDKLHKKAELNKFLVAALKSSADMDGFCLYL